MLRERRKNKQRKKKARKKEREKAKRKHHIIFVSHSYVMKDARRSLARARAYATLHPSAGMRSGAVEEETRVT